MKKSLFVCYPRCTTCQKARRWLEERGAAVEERDIKEERPTADELRAWHAKSGLPLKRFFNTSGLKYKELHLKDKLSAMSEDEQGGKFPLGVLHKDESHMEYTKAYDMVIKAARDGEKIDLGALK